MMLLRAICGGASPQLASCQTKVHVGQPRQYQESWVQGRRAPGNFPNNTALIAIPNPSPRPQSPNVYQTRVYRDLPHVPDIGKAVSQSLHAPEQS